MASTASMFEEPWKKNTLKFLKLFASLWGCLRNHEALFSCLLYCWWVGKIFHSEQSIYWFWIKRFTSGHFYFSKILLLVVSSNKYPLMNCNKECAPPQWIIKSQLSHLQNNWADTQILFHLKKTISKTDIELGPRSRKQDKFTLID